MKKQTLVDTNPYLKDPNERKRLVRRSVRTSCGVEGIKNRTDESHLIKIPSRGEKRIYKNLSK